LPNDLLLDPELRHRQRKRRRLLKIGGSIALGLLLVLVLARPTRHAIKAWQARRHAAEAFRLIEDEKWVEAQKEAGAAYLLRASEPEAIRAVARFLSRTRQPEALGFWKALREKESLSRQDLRDEATAALTAGDAALAEAAVKELSGKMEGGPGAADHLLAAQVATQNGRREVAADHLEKVVADPKATARQQLQAAIFQLAIVTPDLPHGKETQTAAWTRLTKLARRRDAVALDALTILAQQILSRPNEIVIDPAIMPDEEVVQALQSHPRSGAPQKLLALDLEMHADGAQRDALIEQAIATWGKAGNEPLAVLARWLNGKGEYQRELDTIPLQRALQTRELFLQRLDALGALGQWDEIKRLLQEETFPLDPVIERMYLARCNQQLGEITAAKNNWQRAIEAAADDQQKLLFLADYAEKNGATEIAAAAYDRIARDTPRARAAQQGRLRLAQQARNTQKIHTILAEMLKQWPDDTAIQNDEAYTRLLMAGAKDEGKRQKEEVSGLPPITNNEEPITVERLAEDLVRLEPASLPHRTLLALARLKTGQPAKALEVYSGLHIPPNAAPPSAIAVHAAVLAANGQEEDAQKEAAQIKPDQLLPEEQVLIQKLTN
jgi:hypothetical protein